MRRYRVLLGADTYPPDINGAARFAERLAAGLAGRGHDVHVMAPSADGPPAERVRDGVTVHGVRSVACPGPAALRVGLPWRAAQAAAESIVGLAPDVAHVQAHFSVGRAVASGAVRAGVPLVATNHFMPENLVHHLRVPAWAMATVARLSLIHI